MVCFSPVGFDLRLTFRALALRQSKRRANAQNVNGTANPKSEKHTISTLVDQTQFNLLANTEKRVFSKLVFQFLCLLLSQGE